MKKLSVLFAAMLLFGACSSGDDDQSPISSGSNNISSSSSGNGGGNLEGFENGQIINARTEEPYTGSGNIYMDMADERDSNGNPILTEETMLLVGTMDNGKITFDLPPSVDSRFLFKIDGAPPTMQVQPLGVEMWSYTDPFYLKDNSGKYVGDIFYIKQDDTEEYVHAVLYWYFSKAVRMVGSVGSDNYEIDAKEGWNKIYWLSILKSKRSIITTDLSKVPDGLIWKIWEELEN